MRGVSEGSSPAMLYILVTSRDSSAVMGGRMEGRDLASRVLPLPGGPDMTTLWPPLAATSSARLTCSWPLMWLMSVCGMSASGPDG